MLTYENSDCSGTATEINGMCGPNEEEDVGLEAFGCLLISAESECATMDICIYMNFSVLMSGYSMTLNNDGTVISTIPGGCDGGGFRGCSGVRFDRAGRLGAWFWMAYA